MMYYGVDPDFDPALIAFGRVLAKASIFFLHNLAEITDPRGLREGDEDHDYYLEVPADQLEGIRERVAELLRTVQEQFAIEITLETRPPPA